MPLLDAQVILDRGPFDPAAELALMREHRIDLLVTKNSGGTAAAGKLSAARDLGIPVVMISRPPDPPGPIVDNVADAVAWCIAGDAR
jgi:precorrin-6A/cobalt-precorrin-6A reductase